MSEILSNYIMGINSSLTLIANITINFEEGSSDFNVENTILFEFEGTTTELFTVGDVVVDIGITFYYSGGLGALIDVGVDITLHNPMSFNITVNSFEGEVYLNDSDSSQISYIIYTTPLYSADQSYYIDNTTLQAAVDLPANGQKQGNADIPQIDDLETGTRLADEYLKDGQVELDIKNGIMVLQIGGFVIAVKNIDLDNIYVSSVTLNI